MRHRGARNRRAAQTNDFYTGIEVIARALLHDIEFLYRVERGTPVADHAGVFRLGAFEIATRMSYLIWATAAGTIAASRASIGGTTTRAASTAR